MLSVVLFWGLVALGQSRPTKDGDIKDVEFRMPNVQPQKPDTYLCVPMKMEEIAKYVVGFVPHANMSTAHHMLLYGCEEPGQTDKVWNCGEMSMKEKSSYTMAPVCQKGSAIIYAWAMDAPQLTLPKDVGFKVGGNSEIQWLVLQVHYKDVSNFVPPKSGSDHSGITMKVTETEQPKRAGVYLLGTDGRLDPHETVYMEAACKITEDFVMHPFAFRTHAHTHGQVNAGYRVREGQWTEVGRQTPKKPQMFYNTTDPDLTVREGDYLAARCTMTNDEDRTVYVGPTQNDEMCNFYIMYYVTGDKILRNNYCFSSGPPRWYWSNIGALNYQAAPKSASMLPGSDKLLVETMSHYDKYADPEYRELDSMDDQLLVDELLGRNGDFEDEDEEDEDEEGYGDEEEQDYDREYKTLLKLYEELNSL
ncbi:peptidylglycine alpha-hydroxylating monooxygenase-like [Lingula anatina]|uniref:peptidylglycine monooxygenase n=1 Tax=Lingula anatina TaxID=7574 RepID=A0A1S3JUX9_LINAN|nr:peptidylglycine alpha-hydroxylating monooxygenase-like [Lingula anatina]|eukprot:XP_013413906.1 peptidylglycine alpha-hydroxylating monooxygenase-like [Lingula anatina]